MPNIHYYKARAKWAQAQLNWVTTMSVPSSSASGHVADLTSARVPLRHSLWFEARRSHRLAGKAVSTDGRCTATSPLIFDPVSATGSLIAVVLYKHTGTESTSPLLIYMDEAALPVTMSGAPVHITFPAAGLFVL